MLLRVGELARRTGLTVRALHHYDSIGLLRPSGRSESGYRLYNGADVARLHGIQALRRMGVPLGEMAQMLEADAATLPAILARQVIELDDQISLARALRDRVGVMQAILARGGEPEVDDWLASLQMMSTFEQYFSVRELKLVFERWDHCAAEWPPLLQAIRSAMDRGVPPDSAELQPLARRWMDLAARWVNGDVAFLGRWSSMLREQPDLPLASGMDRALLEYIDEAVRLRLAALVRHIGADGFQRMDKTLDPQWRVLGERTRHLMAENVPPQSAQARQLVRDFQALMDQMVGNDADLRARLMAAYEAEPLLQATAPFAPEERHYLRQAAGP